MDGIKEEDWRKLDDCKVGPETVTRNRRKEQWLCSRDKRLYS